MVGILSIRSKSGKILAERLGFPLFYSNSVYKPQVSTVIRWGSTAYGSFDKEINTADAIRKAADKERARRIFLENGLPTPELLSVPPNRFPCVGRRQKHFGGKRFYYCYDRFDAQRAIRRGATYFSPYFPKTREYRIHVGSGKLLGIAVKENGNINAKNWNRKQGFIFRYLHSFDWDREAIRLAKKAVSVLGLDFGAVDILSDPTDSSLPRLMICEVNCTPAMSNFMLNKYTEYFKRVTQEDSEDWQFHFSSQLWQEPEIW